MENKKLMLIDGNSLINRAFYAFGSGNAHLSYNGTPTNATYGFLNMLFRSIEDLKPTHVAIAFDVRAKTFRHEMFTEYKAGRRSTPPELITQLADAKELLCKMGISIVEKQGFEADDVIGTLAKLSPMPTVILTADKDAFQLISNNVELHLTKTGVTTTDVWTVQRVTEEKGITVPQFIDIKALQGDTSDNIPGAKGIGEKTAYQLVQQFGTIDNLYKSLSQISSASIREKLEASKEMVYKSLELATIVTNVPIECNSACFDGYRFSLPMGQGAFNAFNERGFKTLCKRTSLWSDDINLATASKENQNEKTSPCANVDRECFISKITSKENFESIKSQIFNADRIAITNSNNGFAIATSTTQQYDFPVKYTLLDEGFDYEELFTLLKPVFESNIPKIVFDSKALKTLLSSRDILLENVTIDVKICEHLLKSKTGTALDDIGKMSAYELYSEDYLKKLEHAQMLDLYDKMELPLVDILLDMEKVGAKISRETLSQVSNELAKEIAEVSEQIYVQAGEQFNINSPKILSEVLFKKLGLETLQKTKTGFSTNEEVLQKLYNKHPIVPFVMRYRKLFKLLSTYVNGYKSLLDEEGFVHTTFNNTATVTGRLSSSEPNLQNIPARSEESKRIRKLFTSRFEVANNLEGFLVCADYSQIELRILAHLSGDESMISAFTNNRDIHTETAIKIYDAESTDEITADMRRVAKAVNFGIIYGISAFGLSNSTGMTTAEAAKFIEKYFTQFPKIKAFLDGCRDFALEHGYVKTLFNRRRYLPELHSNNANMVQFGTRAAMNMPMQGAAADIIKAAMIAINAKLKNSRLKSLMIAQIHDELVFDVPKNEVDKISELIKSEMESVIKLSVPLQVDISVSKTL